MRVRGGHRLSASSVFQKSRSAKLWAKVHLAPLHRLSSTHNPNHMLLDARISAV